MPLSNAEKQRRYRERLKDNPEKKEQIRKKNLDRIQKKAKKVKEMTEEEKNDKRIIWRNQKRKQKEKKKEKQKIEEVKKTEVNRSQRELFYQRHLKKVRVSYKQSLSKIEKLKKIVARLRKSVFREKNKHNYTENTLNKLLLSKDTEIDLLTTRNEVLENTLKTVYKAGNKISKRRIKSHVINDRKGIFCSSRSRAKLLGLKYLREHNKKAVTQKIQITEEVTRFFVRDDISRITAGKKECRTQDKDRKQIRYLTDTLTNLYSIYKSEGGKYSFTNFFLYKPFYVLSPTLQSRQTCMCIKHSNVDFLLKALKSNNMIDRGFDLKDILTRIVCNINSHECMYNQCSKCLNNKIELKNNSEEVKWNQWESVKHTYKKSENGQNKLIETRKMTKQIKTGTASEITQQFNKHITEFKKHYFNMKIQQSQYQKCMRQLGPHEIMIICDFLENYGCKLSDEIQAMHYGASRQQITLHCGVVYFNDRSQSFCSVSDDLCHEPAAIWAHLIPVIVYVKNLGSDVKVIHFYSDGPSSQYRQKKNFYPQSLFAAKLHLDYITWSYTESGHGKGVADGIGGSVKRNLDRQVTYSRDIKNAEDAHININKVMQSVKCFLIAPNEVDNMKKIIPNNLKPIQGTNGVHQVITTPENNVILYRVLSCFCGTKPGTCSCYNPKKHLLTPNPALPTNRVTRSTVNDTVHEEVAMATAKLRPKPTIEINKSQHRNQPAQPTNTLPEVRDDDENAVSLDVEVKTDIDLYVDNMFSGDKLNFNLLYDDVLPDWIEDNVPQNRDDAVAPSLSEDEVIKILPLSANVSPKRHVPLCEPSTSKGHVSKRIDAQLNLMAPKQKRMKVLLPEQKENRNSSRSLKTVVTRYFICRLCNLRQLFYKNNMTQCISCKKNVCRACTGQVHSIDYICDRCFESD